MKIKVFVLAFIIIIFTALSVPAGDVANFINLGFSGDCGYFMFAMHGVDGETNKPFSEIYTVDIQSNGFAPQGVARESFAEKLQPGQDSAGALYALLEKNSGLAQRFRVNHLLQGRPLYITAGGAARDSIEFRDFNTQTGYSVQLNQKNSGGGAQVKSAFHIGLSVTRGGGKAGSYTVGRPDYFREQVSGYKIHQVILSPDEKNLVFVIEREQYSLTGKTIRYMVETVKIF